MLKCVPIDIIGIKKPTYLDKVIESIPKPKGAVPNFGLPKWKVMPLESKIPMVPGPEGAYNFSRRKVGKKLWIGSEDAEFNLSDPYCHEVKFTYDSLHDEHLVRFFRKPNNLKHLLKSGLITNTLDAKCSLKDYNMYRKYLRNLHVDSIKQELRRSARISREKRALQYAEDQARKEANLLRRRERLVEASQQTLKLKEMQEKEKIKAQKEKARVQRERMKSLIQARREERKQRTAKAKAREEEIQLKRKAAAEISKQKIIHTLVEWKQKEAIRKKSREARLKLLKEQKCREVEDKWELKQELQKKQIEKEKFLLECVNNQREKFIKEYDQKIKKERERMDELLHNMKLYIRCYMARRLPRGKSRICCKDFDLTEDDGEYKPRKKSSKATKGEKRQSKGKKAKKRKGVPSNKKLRARPKVAPKKNKKFHRKKSVKKPSMTEQQETKPPEEAKPEEAETVETKVSKQSLPTPIDRCRCELIKASTKTL